MDPRTRGIGRVENRAQAAIDAEDVSYPLASIAGEGVDLGLPTADRLGADSKQSGRIGRRDAPRVRDFEECTHGSAILTGRGALGRASESSLRDCNCGH